ncbi:MAG TPA: hypothetical protein VG013_38890 [Gemmataceae bacterium]|nr:hypothetical protein [Gemmataceae bacterium]
MAKQKELAATTKTKRPGTRPAAKKRHRHKSTIKIIGVSHHPTVMVWGTTAIISNNVTCTLVETGAEISTLSSPGWSVDFGKLQRGMYHVRARADGEGSARVSFTIKASKPITTQVKILNINCSDGQVQGSTATPFNEVCVTFDGGTPQCTLSNGLGYWSVYFGKQKAGTHTVKACADNEGCATSYCTV